MGRRVKIIYLRNCQKCRKDKKKKGKDQQAYVTEEEDEQDENKRHVQFAQCFIPIGAPPKYVLFVPLPLALQ